MSEALPCREETCCPPALTYRSDANPNSDVPNTECPTASVAFNPVDGSLVIFPTLVAIACNVAGATIRYTVDGTEPTAESTLYSVPFEVASQAVMVKARAFLTDCDPGPVSSASYLNSGYQFSYVCDTGDKAGVFGEFAANGEANDYQFVLQFTPLDPVEIIDITILQTDATGFWDSGQSWGTTEWIYPYPDPAVPFHTYPLVLIDQAGPTQLFSAYQTTLGTYSAIAREWRMWGQPRTPLNGYFQLAITLGDGTIIKRLISTVCGELPPACGAPGTPEGVASCFQVSLIFTVLASSDWRLFRRDSCAPNPEGWGQGFSGTADVSGIIELGDTGINPGCIYEYYVSHFCGGQWVDGPVSVAFQVPPDCVINATTDEGTNIKTICQGDSTILSWESTNCGTVEYSTNGVDFTSLALSGTLEVTPLVTTTYTFSGVGACGTINEHITVTVELCATAFITNYTGGAPHTGAGPVRGGYSFTLTAPVLVTQLGAEGIGVSVSLHGGGCAELIASTPTGAVNVNGFFWCPVLDTPVLLPAGTYSIMETQNGFPLYWLSTLTSAAVGSVGQGAYNNCSVTGGPTSSFGIPNFRYTLP